MPFPCLCVPLCVCPEVNAFPQGAWGKRGWSNLQGAWGKRSDGGDDAEDEALEEEELQVSPEALARMVAVGPVKRGWTLWGKRPDYPAISPRSTNWSSLRGKCAPHPDPT